MTRPKISAGCAVLSALLLMGWAGCSRSKPADKVTSAPAASPTPTTRGPVKIRFRAPWFPQAEQGGHYQAEAKGYFKEAGIEVETLPGGPNHAAITGLLAGQDDVEMSESVDIITRISSGLPLVIIGGAMQHDPLAVMVHEDSPVHTLADLNGRSIMAVPGTTFLDYVKWKYGISFNLIPMNYGIAQFMADPNFIQQCFATNEPFFVAQHGGKARTLLIAQSGYDPYWVWFTTRKFAHDHPQELRAFIAASIRGWNDVVRGDSTAGSTLIQSLNAQMSPELIAFSLATMAGNHLIEGDPAKGDRTGLITTRRLQQQIDLLVAIKAIPKALPVSDVASFDFLPPDLQALTR